MSKKYYNYKKSHRYVNETKKSKVEILLVIITVILSVSQIFGIFYPIFSNLYTSVDKFLRKINMVILSLGLSLIVTFISYFIIRTILEYLYLRRDKFLNMKFKKYFFINIIFVVIVYILLFQTGISFFIYFCYEITKLDIILVTLIPISFVLCIFLYSYTKIEVKYIKYKHSFLNTIIKHISSSKLILFIIIFNALMINTGVCLKNYSLPYEFDKLENKLNAQEKIKNDDKIKLRIIVDSLLEKMDIKITDEDIKNEKARIIEKDNIDE